MSQPLRLRFAPSPTGSLHLGNARTALFNWLLARQSGGCFILRIEDTDTDREQEGSETGILRDLHWLGLCWDEGPERGGERGPYRQSERSEAYREAADLLLREGRAYYDFSTEEELKAERDALRGESPLPSELRARRRLSEEETRKRLAAGDAAVVRFITCESDREETGQVRFQDRLRGEMRFALRELTDPVILRSDGRPTYNFAVVVDDAAMAVDLVLRGDDHLSNTPRQVLMFEALGYRVPEFAHLPMVRGADGSRLSKRHGAVSVVDYSTAGYPIEGLLNALALLGWAPDGDTTILSVKEMVERFDLDKVNRSPATFDQEKLEWICGQHIQRMGAQQLAGHVAGRLVEAGNLDRETAERSPDWMVQLAEIVRTSIVRFDQAAPRLAGVFAPGGKPQDSEAAAMICEREAQKVLAAMLEVAESDPPTDVDGWRRLKQKVKEQSGAKGKGLFQPLRIAITGEAHGPELDSVAGAVAEGHKISPDCVISLLERIRRTTEFAQNQAEWTDPVSEGDE